MNINKIACVICENDSKELSECLYYLRQINIPDGYDIEIKYDISEISIMSFYEEAMQQSDAKYKIYLHQDTFIINPNFLYELIEVFESDPQIGMIGCVGRRKMPADAFAVDGWNTGKVYDNVHSIHGYENGICEVDALDGLLLATQYDIPWRDDIFKGWDYYDISQCYEFHRRGLKVVVPEQSKTWCYHDNHYSIMNNYDIWRKKFVEEYQDIYPFRYTEHISENQREMSNLIDSLTKLLEQYLDKGQFEEFSAICKNPNVENQLWAREYCLVNSIYSMEQNAISNTDMGIYKGNKIDTLNGLRKLKHLLKRLEYDAGDRNENIIEIIDNYSIYAICIVCISYCEDRRKVYEKILSFCKERDLCSEYDSMLMFNNIMTEQNNAGIQHMQYLITRDDTWTEYFEEKVLFIIDNISWETTVTLDLLQRFSECYQICLIVRNYDADMLQKLDEMHIEILYMQQPQYLSWDMQEKLYNEFKEVIVIGDDMDIVVEQWHSTHVKVSWYISQQKKVEKKEYSENILLHMV